MLPDRLAPAWLATIFVVGSAITPLRAQHPQHEHEVPAKVPLAGARAGDPHEEMLKLIGKVELRLREIDRLLFDAADRGRSVHGAAAPAGIDEILVRTRDRARQVVEDFDRILELADHPHPPGGT